MRVFFRYTKYLYPLECKKQNLSHPTDLQVAIEGNKREGRRSSYGAFPDILPPISVAGMAPMSPMSALMAGQHGLPRPNPFGNGAHPGQFPPSKSPFEFLCAIGHSMYLSARVDWLTLFFK